MHIVDRILLRFVNLDKKSRILRKYFYHIGERSAICCKQYGREPYLIWIGDDVIVATGVEFITHDASYYNAYRYAGRKGAAETEKMGGIILRNNCFVGCNSILLPGADIGENSIIAAGSIVNKKIPPNEVWGGNQCSFYHDNKRIFNKSYKSS